MRETERGKENEREKGKKTANSTLTDISTGMVRRAKGRGWRVEERSGEEREGMWRKQHRWMLRRGVRVGGGSENAVNVDKGGFN